MMATLCVKSPVVERIVRNMKFDVLPKPGDYLTPWPEPHDKIRCKVVTVTRPQPCEDGSVGDVLIVAEEEQSPAS